VPHICRPTTCSLFSNYCRKTCDLCNPQQNGALSWIDEFFSDFSGNMQIIGGGGSSGFPFQKPSKGSKEFKPTSCPPRSGLLPREYHGTLSTSASGRKCQKWNVQEPHHHDKTPEEFPDKNLGDHNYCRNPDDDINGAWCFTEDPNLRWEYCDNTDFACSECVFNNGECDEMYECFDTNRLKENTVICRLPETTTDATTYTTFSTPTTEFSTSEEKDQSPRIVQQEETCGMPKVPAGRQLRIVNGEESSWGQHPWMLAVGYK
jgi:hypothetical protein